MNRRLLAVAFTIVPMLLGGLARPAIAAEPKRPNIVLILADDLGWGDVGFNGRTDWATPNLDRLAQRGTIFKRFYTAAVVCAPSRGALLTGKYTIHSGVSKNNEDLPAEQVTIAEALKARGYATALFGKWHHGAPRVKGQSYIHPMDQGFDEFFGFTDAVHAWEKFPTTLWDGRERKPVTGYADDLFTDHAVEFIRRHKDGPFFLYLPYIACHFLIEAPAEEVALHQGKFAEDDPKRPLNATYAAMATRLDKCVGRVVTALEQSGLAEETLIVFTSDHGATFETGNQGTSAFHDSNRPFRGQKRTLWEGGIRVPALAVWPGQIPAGAVSDEVMHMTDLFPTLLAAAGGEPESSWHVDGLNLLPVWRGKAHVPERTLFWEWRTEGSDQLAAMRGEKKLVITQKGKPELFDVVKDPAERRNVAAQYPEIVRRLNDELKTWLATEIQP
ncbi:MAG: sulfatase-like hydrolase/transferase [Isosphaeraceae bacterium]|nr:sulfatase-like hydrolase/transferase [Isosphaeraceae bacterium]